MDIAGSSNGRIALCTFTIEYSLFNIYTVELVLMLAKLSERQQAIKLRKEGKSYSEIIDLVPVSQSSLSLWLKNIRLTKEQTKRLLFRKQKGQSRGGLVRRKFREELESKIVEEAMGTIQALSKRELWLLGIIAYWCEGGKQKEGNISQGVVFANSDPFLLRLFVKWVKEFCQIRNENIVYTLYIHETGNISLALDYWSKILAIDAKEFGKTSIKRHNVLTKRKNTGENYHGLIRIRVRKSTNLNRTIKGWVMGINNFI